MHLHLVTCKREMEVSSKTPCLHFIETAPSVLRKIPSVVVKEHVVGIWKKLWGVREKVEWGNSCWCDLSLGSALILCHIMSTGIWAQSEL